MTYDEETLAIALLVQREQGAEGYRYISEQIGAMALKGEMAGIARWKEIAQAFARIDAPKH